MKIRKGFVSNSSSSSFIIGFEDDIKKMKEEDFLNKYEDRFVDFEFNYNIEESNLQDHLEELKLSYGYQPDINNFKIKDNKLFISKKEVAKYFKAAGEDINNLKKVKDKKLLKHKIILDIFNYDTSHEEIEQTLQIISTLESKQELFQFYKFRRNYLSEIGTLVYDITGDLFEKIQEDIDELNSIDKTENKKIETKLNKLLDEFEKLRGEVYNYFDIVDKAKAFLDSNYELKLAMYFNFIIFENKMIKRRDKYLSKISQIMNIIRNDEISNEDKISKLKKLFNKYFNENKINKYYKKEASIIHKNLYKNLQYMDDMIDGYIVEFIKNILRKPKYLKSLKVIFDLNDKYIEEMNKIINTIKRNINLIDNSNYFYLYELQGYGEGWDNLISTGVYEDYPWEEIQKIRIGKEIYKGDLK